MEKANNFVFVLSLYGVLCGVAGELESRRRDAFDEIRSKIDRTTADNCFVIDDPYLPKDSVSHYPDVKEININPVFPNRTAMLHIHNMAMNRAFFWSYVLQSRFIDSVSDNTKDPGMMYYFLSTAADMASNPFLSASAIYFSPFFTTSYRGSVKTLPRFAPRAYRDTSTRQLQTAAYIIEDLGAFDKINRTRDYTLSEYHRTNEFYTLWLPDKAEKGHDTKTTYQVEIRYADNTNKTFTFYGPPGSDEDPGPVRWTRPYYDCGRLNKWLVGAVSPVTDLYLQRTQSTDIRYPAYTAAVVMEMDFDKIDINQCPPGQGNEGPNRFASTAKCKLETTECEPIHGWGFRRGGYQCRCRPGYRLPGGVSHPFPGDLIENATSDQYLNNFDCITTENVNGLSGSGINGNTTTRSHVNIDTASRPLVDVKVTSGPIADVKVNIVSHKNVNITNGPRVDIKITNGSPLEVNITNGPVLNIKISNAPNVDINVMSGPSVDVTSRSGPRVDVNATSRTRRDVNATSATHIDLNDTNESLIDVNATSEPLIDVSTSSEQLINVNATSEPLIDVNATSKPLLDVDTAGEPDSFDSKKTNINFIRRVWENRQHCYVYRPYQLVLNGDVDFGQEVEFEYQAKAAVRLSNFLSAYLQVSNPTEVFSENRVADQPLTEDQMFGETLSIVATDSEIFSAGIYWDRNKFPNKKFFAPTTYKFQKNTRTFKSEDLARLNNTDDFYMDKEWFASVKYEWSLSSFDNLEKHFLKIKIRTDELGPTHLKNYERYPTLYKAANFIDGYWSRPYFDCEGHLKRWVVTYASPFFGWDSMKSKLEFKGAVAVTMPLMSLALFGQA